MSSPCSLTLTPYGNAGFSTFAEAKANTAIQTAVGACLNTDEGRQRINDAVERLMYRGDWSGTNLRILLSVRRGIVTLPRQVLTVRYINVTSRYIPVWNDSFEFLPRSWNACDFLGGWGSRLAPSLTAYGMSATFNQPPTSSCVLQISGIPADDGAIIQVFGVDPNGNALRTDNGDGTFSNGISLTLNQPFSVGTDLVGQVQRVIKPVTQGPVSLFSLDTVSGDQTALAVYDPGDTNPSFAQYNLHGNCCVPQPLWSAVAMVKLKFIPVVADSDPIMIPSLHALALFIKGARYAEQGDRASALGYQADAVKELNLQDTDLTPDEQIPLRISPFGSAPPSYHGVGRII